MRPSQVAKIAPFLAGGVFIVVGAGIWATECSNPPLGAMDIVCFTYNPYGWLAMIGMEVVAAWTLGILLFEAKPLTRLRGFWKTHMSPHPTTAIVLTTLSSGLLGVLLRWINGWPPFYQPFYPENFLDHYATWLFGGAIAGFVFSIILNLDSSRKARVHGLQ